MRKGIVNPDNKYIVTKFYKSQDATESLIAKMCISLHVKQYGNRSRPVYLEIEKKEREAFRRAKIRAKGTG